MANELLYVPCEIWGSSSSGVADTLNVSAFSKIMDYAFYVPYCSSEYIDILLTGNLTTGQIYNPAYYTVINNIPDFNLFNGCITSISANGSISVPTLISDTFPHSFPITENTAGSTMTYILRCKENGYFYYGGQFGSGSGGQFCYVWTGAGGLIRKYTTGQTSGFMGAADERFVCGLVYHALDSDGNFSDVSTIGCSRLSSGGGELRIGAITRHSSTVLTLLNDFLTGVQPGKLESDPYAAGGNSDASDSAGTFANTGSDVGLPGLPQADPSATGFMKAYNPSGTDLNNFASYLWNTLDIGALKSLYSNPMEAVIGLLMIPASPTVGAPQTVNLGNIATTVSMPVITNRFKEVDCGTVTIPEWWGAYLDYSPYTEVSIYLPYVGVQQLDTNEVMGKPVHVVYHIDVLTGALIALLECGGKCIYHFAGNCGVQIPITASSFGGILQTALSVGISAIQSIASPAAGNFQTVSEVATSVFSGAKTRVQKSGSLGSAAGFADNQTPFFIIQRPVQCKPEEQNKFSGYPSYITDTLSDLTGYTEIELIHLSDISATDTEREEIDSLLRAGVIL